MAKTEEKKENKEQEQGQSGDTDMPDVSAPDPEMQAKDDELDALKKELEVEKAKNKYKAPAPIPKEQLELPKGMQEAQVETVVKDMSTVIKNRMMELKDMATMEVFLDTHVRMKNRLESIKKMGSAEHLKIRNVWKTIPPAMHISNLEGKKINNDEFEVSFGVFELDEKGNKKLYVHYADVLLHDGSTIRRATSAEYRIAYIVTEKIKSSKPITREVIRFDRI